MLNKLNKIVLPFFILFSFHIFSYADEYDLEKIIDDLYKPWGMSFIDDENLLVTQKSGEILKINLTNKSIISLEHDLNVLEYGQGGMLDVLYDDGWVYVCYTESIKKKLTTTSIASGKLVDNKLINFKNIFQSEPPVNSDIHWGSRLAMKDGHLYASVGERRQGIAAQDPTNHFGTIIRINPDGSIPEDNPIFVENHDWLPEIFQIGLRNPQGMARSPIDNEMYITNHGPKGGDFFGKVSHGTNYGWDIVAWGGLNYEGSIVGDASAWKPGFLKPIYRWIPSIAVSNIVFYTGKKFNEWEGQVLLTSLRAQKFIKLDYKDGKVQDEDVIFERKGRIRDVEINSKGEIFIIIDDAKSGIWELKKI